jgi:hypothetical protein
MKSCGARKGQAPSIPDFRLASERAEGRANNSKGGTLQNLSHGGRLFKGFCAERKGGMKTQIRDQLELLAICPYLKRQLARSRINDGLCLPHTKPRQ